MISNKKILIIGPSWVGDMIMAQSLFKLIKHHNKNTIIDVLSPRWSCPIVNRMPEVNEIIESTIMHKEFCLKKRWQLAKLVKSKKYDLSYILTNSWKSALIPFLAKIPIRIGWLGEMRFGLLNKIYYYPKRKFPKMVDRYTYLFGIIDNKNDINPKLSINQENLKLLINKFNLLEIIQNKNPILAICPGASFGSSKRWPIEYYSQVAIEKIKQNWNIWVFGSKQDKTEVIDHLTDNIKEKITNYQANYIDFSDQLSLMDTVDLFSVVTTVISNDSGLMHLAAAVDKPIIGIYGSTTAEHTPPLSNKATILSEELPCKPCFKRECPLQHHNCMRNIKPNKILNILDMANKT